MKKTLSLILGVLVLLSVSAFAQYPIAQQRGGIYASDFAYGYGQVAGIGVGGGGGAAGAQTLLVNYGYFSTPTGLQVFPFSTTVPITVGNNSSYETVTPTAVSCSTPLLYQTCSITATFTYAHGPGDTIRTGTFGLAESMAYAFSKGGGLVTVDYQWAQIGGTSTNITNIVSTSNTYGVPYWNVGIQDLRSSTPVFWNVAATGSTVLGTPSTLTNTTAAFTTNAATGNYGTGTYYMCVSFVDVMGNEGTCSGSYSHAGLATSYITFTPPTTAASGTLSGAVGYTMYVSLTSGTITLMYKVPITSSVCTMTSLAPIPACALANSTYGQSGATATVTAITLATSPTAEYGAVVSTAAIIHGLAIGMTTYGYVPMSKPLTGGPIPVMAFAAPTSAVDTTGVAVVMASVAIPSGYMNFVGRSIRVCGIATNTGTSSATAEQVAFYWDAVGSNTTGGLPILLGGPVTTTTLASAINSTAFCQTFTTQAAGASATAGSLMSGSGWITVGDTVAITHPGSGVNPTVGAVGSLNLAQDARLHVAYINTGSPGSAGYILQSLTVEPL